MAQKRQYEAYHAVLSPFLSSGREGIYLSRPEIGLHDLPCKQYEKIR